MHLRLSTSLLYSLAVGLIALFVWLVFRPAIMTADGLVIYGQALNGSYDDWHPPIMALTLHAFMTMGPGLKGLMLLQCLAGYQGIYFLGLQLFKRFGRRKPAWLAFLLCVVVTLPASAFPFYAMTFLKDAWCAIGFVWIAFLTLHLYQEQPPLWPFRVECAVLILIMSLTVLSRHNAVVIIPVFYYLLFILLRQRKVAVSCCVPIALMPVLLIVLFDLYAYEAREVKRTYPERQFYAAELVGLLDQDSTLCAEVPYTCGYLQSDWRSAYEYGEVGPVMWWGEKQAVRLPGFDRNAPQVGQEYWASVRHYPLLMSLVKVKAFGHLLLPERHKYWFHAALDKNEYGLAFNETFSSLRESWIWLSRRIHTYLVFVIADPFPYFLINLIMLGLLAYRRKHIPDRRLVAGLLLLPLLYYLSYLPATTGDDIRFTYPSNLLMHLLCLGYLIRYVDKRLGGAGGTSP